MYRFKMLFVSLLIGVLVIGVSSGLRNCDNCTAIMQCTEAMQLFVKDKSEATTIKIRNAHCGTMKVCCSDFSIISINARSALGVEGENGIVTNEDEIENHPNNKLLPDECGTIGGDRIIGGKRAKINEYPWLALISHKINGKKQFNCGGTVINDRYVLTAAHCIRGREIAGVRIGEYNISSKVDCFGFGPLRKCQSNLQDIAVSQAIVHPDYVRIPIVVNDIGLLRLRKPINISVVNAGAICLPNLRSLLNKNIAEEMGVVAGWGITENRTRSNTLLKVEIPILSQDKCNSYYDRNRSKTVSIRFRSAFCAGKRGQDSCGGDSGGPLMLMTPNKDENYKYFQFGIVSHGPVQCGSQTPGVYMDVRKFMKWILDTIKP